MVKVGPAGPGLASPPEALFQSLVERYREAHRAYHNLDHVDECQILRQFRARPSIYSTEHFGRRLKARAHTNLTLSVES